MVVIKIRTPFMFTGKEGEDTVGWVHCYERVMRYNRWEDEDLCSNFEMSLEGAASKCHTCLDAIAVVPREWEV